MLKDLKKSLRSGVSSIVLVRTAPVLDTVGIIHRMQFPPWMRNHIGAGGYRLISDYGPEPVNA